MTTDARDPQSEKSGRSKHFWTPIWITAIGCAGVGAFLLGQDWMQQQWDDNSRAILAVEAMRSPAEALEDAERQLLADRIDFWVYRDLLRVALSRTDSDVRNAAYRSIHTVLTSDRDGYANLLKSELKSMPAQVFIVATKESAPAAQDIEQKLKMRETAMVIQDPTVKAIGQTQVLCHDQDVCKQTAPSVVDLLHEEGYQVDEPKPGDSSATPLNNWIEIELAAAKPTNPVRTPKKPVVAKAHHPKAANPGLVAQQ